MSTVDSRIVTMKFDNAQFEKGVHTTIDTLDKLKKNLAFEGTVKGLSDIQGAINRVSFSSLEGGITGISKSFLAMSTVAITALSNVANRAVDAGLSMAKSLTLDPLIAGFQEYELKLGSIQTILSNTARHGTNLDTVNAELEELNKYADQTIYNFGQMTKNVGLFTNAGIKVEEATDMIKGFSNVAAASGTNAEGAASAAYQLSQALSAGKVTLQDWRSLTNVGMGNKNMQDGIIEIAKAMGTFKGTGATANDALKDFNGSLEKGWLKADVMSTYLKIMSGDMDATAMKAAGLSDSVIASFQAQQKTAQEAATKVRTFTQFLGTLRESVGSGWSATFETVVGNFEEATELWTSVSNAIGGFVQASGDARNKVLADWKALGGRTELITGIKNIFQGLMGILKPIKDAFREIFPRRTGQQIFELTQAFRNFTEHLKVSGQTSEQIKTIFKGIFAIFSVVTKIVGGVVKVFFNLIGALFGLAGAATTGEFSILGFLAKIAQLFIKINELLTSGGRLNSFFEGIGNVVKKPIELVGKLIDKIQEFYASLDFSGLENVFEPIFYNLVRGFFDFKKGLDFEDIQDKIKTFSESISSLFDTFRGGAEQPVTATLERVGKMVPETQQVIDVATESFSRFQAFLERIKDALPTLGEKIKDSLGGLKDLVVGMFEGADPSILLHALNAGFLTGIFVVVRKGMKAYSQVADVLNSIKGSFDALSGTLGTLQSAIRVEMVKKIAIAILILSASMFILAQIPPDRLASAAGGMVVAMASLLAAMKYISKIMAAFESIGMKRLLLMMIGMNLFSLSLLLLAVAMAKIGQLNWEELGRGIVGLGATIGLLLVSFKVLSKESGSLVKGGIALLLLSFALAKLVDVIIMFSGTPWDALALGLAKAALLIVALGLSMQTLPSSMIDKAAGLLILAAALKLLSIVVLGMNDIPWGNLVQGIAKTAAMIVVLGLSLHAMPPNMLKIAAALILVSIALKIMASVMEQLAALSIGDTIGALIALGGGMIILSKAANAMAGSFKGIAAMMLAAIALTMLVPALLLLGQLSVGQLVGIAAALVVIFAALAVGGYLLSFVTTAFLLFGAAILLIGAGVFLLGVGIGALVAALVALAALGMPAIASITLVLKALIGQIPSFMRALGEGLRAFLEEAVKAAPAFYQAASAWLAAIILAITDNIPLIFNLIKTFIENLLQTIRDLAPQWKDTAIVLLDTFLDGLEEAVPRIVEAGYNILISILEGIADNIDDVVDAAGDIVITFIDAMADKAVEFAEAGADALIDFLDGMTQAIDDNSEEIGRAGGDLAVAMIKGMVKGLGAGVGQVVDAAKNVAKSALNAAKNFLGINSPSKEFEKLGVGIGEGFVDGIDSYSNVVAQSTENMGKTAVTAMQDTMKSLSDVIPTAVHMQPVVTPVLDLTTFKQDASKIKSLVPTSVAVGTTFQQASTITEPKPFGQVDTTGEGMNATTTVNFEQNNYSPKALSSVEIYRQTRNQLSLAKEALNV